MKRRECQGFEFIFVQTASHGNRYYQYGSPFFNYGLFPQTWEDPSSCKMDVCGDDDPLDVIELGDSPLPMGSVTPVKVHNHT